MATLLEDLQVDAALIERLDAGVTGARLTGPTFEDAFEELYRLVGDQLRMRPGSFAPNKVAMYLGSLGPGGAERQCAYTATGIGKLGKFASFDSLRSLGPAVGLLSAVCGE